MSNEVIQTYPNSVSHGNLNSIKRLTQTQNLHLNSCFRKLPSSSTDFSYTLPMEIKHVASMRLASIEFPNTHLLFSSKQQNNTFKIKIGDEITIVTIADGNYNYETLAPYLTTLLESLNITCAITNNLYITFTSEVTFSLIFDNNCGWVLGFRQLLYENGTTYTSESLFDAIGDKYVYLSVEDYQYNTNVTNIIGLDKSFIDKSILAKVPIIDEKFSFILYESSPLSKTRVYNGPITLKKIHVKLLDKFGYVIDLNSMDFSFTLELELIYENF